MASLSLARGATPNVGFTLRKNRLLVVDDEPRMLEVLLELLKLHGHDVTSASSGQQAVSLLQAAQFDLVLLDLNMPEMDGFGLMEHIERHAYGVPMIVISGDTTIDAAIQALRKGAHDFVRKPYRAEELLRTIDSALEKKQKTQSQAESTEHLAQSEKWHRYLVHQSPDILYALDSAGRFTFLNDRAEELLGIARSELMGRHYSHLIHEEDLKRAKHLFNERRKGNRAAREVELRLRVNPGGIGKTSWMNVEVSAFGIYEQQNDAALALFCGTYGVARDVTEKKRAQETIHHQAYHDGLTGLPNRLLFRDRLNLSIIQAKRAGHMLAVMFIDLDRFKSINDTLGHAAGDYLLQSVAARLTKCLRESDTVARLGGDEFTLLLPQIADRHAAENAARKVLAALNQPFRIDQQNYSTSASIGIAVYPDDGDTLEALMQNSDVAMYDVKAQGRNNYAFFSEIGNVAYSNRINLGHELHKAIDSKQLELYYQPQVSTHTGAISGLEVLVRWNHPTRGMLLPEEFIPLAEGAGTLSYISDWVIRSACIQLKEWLEYGLTPVRLGINLAAEQIQQHDFVPKFRELLKELQVDPGLLEIEITETTMMQSIESTRVKLIELSELGVKLAIDDFGMGYSSLSYLRNLPINAIKIDRSFVSDIKAHTENSIVKAMILIAKGLRLNLIAEGVETNEQLEFLKSQFCDESQGYLISKPLNASDVTRLLASGRSLLPS
ncbi:MAG: EAL domain-containing protein [Burkholderiales bacterium]